ncbi:MAG: NADH:ubiquinone reductase (Na(+)-transporting) subunit F, partial [Candidatus Marinimicrobia bacterium]|nr:NADH:ubiquinone reductase (Na(+)-transporting) subunit F [Candidatus Neomarinimicrobiota bacterium]
MELTLLSMSVFTGVILVLVLILNFAESKLLPQGNVNILINDEPDKAIVTRPGS